MLLVAVALYSLKIPFLQISDISDVHLTEWMMYIGICMFSFWGLYFFTNAMQNGRFSFVGSLMVISSVFSFLTSLIIYQESLHPNQFISLGLISIGLFYHQKEELAKFRLSKEVILVLLSGFFWGISFVFYLIPIQKIGVFNFTILLELCVLASCILLLIRKDKRFLPAQIDKKGIALCFTMGLMVAGGSLLSHFTLTQLPVSLNILIAMSFEAIVIAVGLFAFREKLSIKDWVMIALATVGSTLLLF